MWYQTNKICVRNAVLDVADLLNRELFYIRYFCEVLNRFHNKLLKRSSLIQVDDGVPCGRLAKNLTSQICHSKAIYIYIYINWMQIGMRFWKTLNALVKFIEAMLTGF